MSRDNRAGMAMLVRKARAYFAPVERNSGTPAAFDPQSAFALDAPPPPWIDLGWIERLKRTPATRVQPVRAGVTGAAVAQFRSEAEARLEFDFLDWGKLQMALADGAQHTNVLAASQGVAVPPVPTFEGSTATTLVLGATGVRGFATGDIVAVDADYRGQVGYVGTGIAAACVRNPDDVGNDANYVRRVTFNVARVLNVTADSLVLAQSLPGGAPPLGAGVQKVVAFADREGTGFFQEWSALFVIAADSGARLYFYYPRLQACAPAQEAAFDLAPSLEALSLHASFTALAHRDGADGEHVLCYRIWLPAPGALLY